MALSITLSFIGGPREAHNIEGVEIFSGQISLGAFEVSEAVLISWGVAAVIIVLAVLFRLFAVPRFTADAPTGIQNMMETALEAMDKFIRGILGHPTDTLVCYMFTLALFLIGCAFSELFTLRAPTADLSVTGTLALITFFLINYYGIRAKGALGRLKSYTQPMAVIAPFRLISDIAVPVSMACRLLGNMLGGMIVMELLRGALGYFAMVPAAAAGLYFNVFHPLIQVYVFVMLSLTFINEAVE